MIKDELRAKMRENRRALTCGEVQEKSGEIQKQLFSLDCFKNAGTVCTFISAFKEPDTVEIIKWLLQTDKKTAVPITDTASGTLSLSYINGMEDLKKGAYNIPEPKTLLHADAEDMDIILVPGLAFDRSGGRMGFGKGYYDRLLSRTNAVKIGLCYDFQLCNKIPTEAHDVPMDLIVTEREIWRLHGNVTY